MPEIAVFDHYEVLTREDGSLVELGRGAMGITYKAVDTRLRIPVALKVITTAYLHSEVARQRFLREARSAAKLRHPNVASVFHLGMKGDGWFYAMEFVDGETLEALIRREGRLRLPLALAITAQVARALNAAARHGLVHRDIKPANLMLVHEDDELTVKVIDFGLAKSSLVGEGEDGVTVSMGGFVGTLAFASPEQLGEAPIDSRSDIYSLGVTLWYMLAGQPPFVGTMAQVISQHLTRQPPFEEFKDLPASVAEVLRKMLEKDREQRFQTPLELRTAIEACLKELPAEAIVVVSPPEDATEMETMLDAARERTGDTRFEVGVVLSGRYRIIESLSETSAGRAFRAVDFESRTDVRVFVLPPEFSLDTAASSALERRVNKLVTARHPNLLGIRGYQTVDQASFVVVEWTEGFSLLELLRARRELGADEVRLLLEQASRGVDHALRLGVDELTFDLRQVLLHFPQSYDKVKLLHAPVGTWPSFELKLHPLAGATEVGTMQTSEWGQTIVGGGVSECAIAGTRPRYIYCLGTMVYELLGGARPSLTQSVEGQPVAARYAPLSTLSEEGNEVLKRALDPARSFESAHEFCGALAAVAQVQTHRISGKSASVSGIAPARAKDQTAAKIPPAPEPPSAAPARNVTEELARAKPLPRRSQSAKPMAAAALCGVVVAALGVGAWNYFSGSASNSSASATPPPAPQLPKKIVQTATPAPPVPTPQPPTGAEMRKAGLKIWTDGGPGSREVSKAVEDFQAAANKNDAPSCLALGECYLYGAGGVPKDEGRAVEYFAKAAQLGDVHAMNRLGDCLVHGVGGKTDYTQAFNFFKQASESEHGDLEALGNLGVLYVEGEGVSADPAKGAGLFEKGAREGSPFCMRLFARSLELGVGKTKNETEAKTWYVAAAKAGDKRAEMWCRQHGIALAN